MVRSKLTFCFCRCEFMSFNPCSRGWCARSRHVIRPPDEGCQFQSLFSWMVRSKHRTAAGRRVRGGGFQSLFSWMVRSKGKGAAPSYLLEMFQSLFSWMVRSKFTFDLTLPNVTGFNPCSRGWCARRASGLRSSRTWHRFQSLFSWMVRSKSTGPPHHTGNICFNPCSRGWCARRPRAQR